MTTNISMLLLQAAALAMCLALVSAESTGSTTATASSSTTTTSASSTTSSSSTTTPAACVVNVALPVISVDCAGFAEHGATCNFTCAAGYVADTGDVQQTCMDGSFDGTPLTCKNFDSCASNPCNPMKSECTDSAPPSVDPICVCAFGHMGPDSVDGEACQLRKRITTSDEGMKVIVGTEEDFVFQFGAEDPTSHSFRGVLSSVSVLEDMEDGPIGVLSKDVASQMQQLRSDVDADLNDLTDMVDAKTASLATSVNTASATASTALSSAVVNANSRMDTQKAGLETSIGDLRSELTTSINTKATSLEQYAVSKVQSLGTAIDGSVASLETRIGATETGVAGATASINNVNTRVTGVSNLVGSVSTTVTSNYNSLTSTTNTLNSKVTTAQTTATNAYNLANSANGKASTAESKASSADTKVSNLISKLGCIYTGCSTNYFCNTATFKCEQASLIPSGILGSSMGNAVVSAMGSSYRFNKRCYRKTVNGASGSTFHSYCNNKSPVFVVCRATNGRYFGGFSSIAFTSANTYRSSTGNWLWRYSGSFTRTTSMRYSQYALYDYYLYGPTFGGGHDWYVDRYINYMYNSYHSYQGNGYTSSWLSGSYTMYASDLEVFYQG